MSRIFERYARTGLVLSLLLTLVATTAISQEEPAAKKKKNPFKETPCESDAADVHQTVWRVAVQDLTRVRQPDRIGGWLARTAYLQTMRRIRDRMTWRRVFRRIDPPEAGILRRQVRTGVVFVEPELPRGPNRIDGRHEKPGPARLAIEVRSHHWDHCLFRFPDASMAGSNCTGNSVDFRWRIFCNQPLDTQEKAFPFRS